MEKNFYEILGVDRSASTKEIKSAYRSLAMKLHPDRRPDKEDKVADKKFKEISEAYDVLSNAEKRDKYDRFGSADAGGGFGGGFGGGDFGDIFGDAFSDMFKGGGRGTGSNHSNTNRNTKGNDLQYNLELEFVKALKGIKYNISFNTHQPCTICKGSGSTSNQKPIVCGQCHGSGSIRQQQGIFAIEQPCPRCNGTGHNIANPCSACKSTGRQMKKKNLLVTIPAGIKTGDRMKVGGEGEAGFNGGTPGDLYISINVKPHVLFSTENNNLKITVPVDAITAMVGGEVMVPSLQGKLVLKIPTSTQNGKILIIKSGGIKNASSKRIGDLFCEIKIITPTSLSSTQRANLYEVLETIDVPSLPNISSWNDKVEEFENELKG